MLKKHYKLLFCFVFLSVVAYANNVQITEVSITSSSQIRCTLSWDNAWNTPDKSPNNHDAVWLFFKYRDINNTTWQHASLASPGLENQVIEGEKLEISVPQDGAGLFLITPTDKQGNITSTTIEITVQDEILQPDKTRLRAYAIEMVYIPEGPFYLGDGASNYSLASLPDSLPYYVESEEWTEQLTSLIQYRPESGIPDLFPKGYSEFYCMKYEISQFQYTDFLNTLSIQQQQNRITASPLDEKGTPALYFGTQSFRNGIAIEVPGIDDIPAKFGVDGNANGIFNETGDGGTRACNWLSWHDLTAYLDWAGLRPMTEFEFEKACRGPLVPVEKEFAWGTQSSVNANTPQNDGTEEEKVSEVATAMAGLANHGAAITEDFLEGPLRSGFAAFESSNRIQAGATYYGIMNMTGNVWELVVNVEAEGLQFQRIYGDGTVDASGFADQSTWPNEEGNGHRGGAWNSWIQQDISYQFRDLSVSDRYYIFLRGTRRNTSGGRGVR